ncbi:MAG: hypothetical protein UHO11_06185 [Treponema sp.]|jgi:hypothetical protein|nr:hypothetical protein [Treponema sp.]
MKKLIAILFIAAAMLARTFAVPVAYNESSEENWSSISYRNVPILKILDSKDGYVVLYQKGKIGTGRTVIPKSWNRGNPENPRKLKVRFLPGGKLKSFMTVVKKDGEFHHVVLTVPENRNDSVWGVISYRQSVEGTDKETLEDLEY